MFGFFYFNPLDVSDFISYQLQKNMFFYITGTGDHTFERRLRLGGPLLKENIATMVLER